MQLKFSSSKISNLYKGDEMIIAEILFKSFIILPAAFIIIGVASYLTSDYTIVYLMVVALFILFSSHWFFSRGKLKPSIQVFLLATNLLITVICTIGQGIHDIGLLAFPLMIVFAGQLLTWREQLIPTLLIILSIAWLGLGSQYGLYQPSQPAGIITELVISLTILGLSTILTYHVTKGLRLTLSKAQVEIEKRKLNTQELEEVLKSKSKLTNAVHARIAESLSIIREIFTKTGKKNTTSFTQTLHDRIISIEVIHERLLANETEKEVDLNDYLQSLSLRFDGHSKWPKIEVSNAHGIQLTIDQAISVGLFFYETFSQVTSKNTIHVSATSRNSTIELALNFDKTTVPASTTLSKIMLQQIHGSTETKEGLIVLSFPISKEE